MTDYGSIGTAVAMIVIAALNAYNLARSKKRDAALDVLKEASDKTAQKMDITVTKVDATVAKVDETVKKVDVAINGKNHTE